MAKPIAVQKLKHGKALCGKTFGGFVDTFNWLVDFCLSLKGDKDVNNANGTVTVDRADPSAPVIRADKHQNEGGGEGGGSSAADRSCFRLVSLEVEQEYEGSEATTEVHRFVVDCYYNVAGITKRADDTDIEELIPRWTSDIDESETTDQSEQPSTESSTDDNSDESALFDIVIYFKLSETGDESFDKCRLGQLEQLQKKSTMYVFPLYLFNKYGDLLCDLRTAPQIQLFEVGLTAEQGGGS